MIRSGSLQETTKANVYARNDPINEVAPNGQYSILCNLTVDFFGFEVGLKFAGLLIGIQEGALLAAAFTSFATVALTTAAGPVGTGIKKEEH